MKTHLNSAIKKLCDVARVNEILLSRQRADLLVLYYHGVLAQARPDSWSYGNDVSADEFRAQLRWLKQHLIPTDLAGLKRFFEGKWTEPKAPFLITFDDGYRNNLTVAAPVLKAEGVPAVFFLSTGYVGTKRVLWNDEVRVRVLHWPESEIVLPNGKSVAFPQDLQARRMMTYDINHACKGLDQEGLARYLEYLRGKTPGVEIMDDPESRQFMSWDEARKLAAMGFEIGSHTVEHRILSQTTPDTLAVELRNSKATLERELQQACTSIAYPNGTDRDINTDVFESVRDAGYEWAFTTKAIWQKTGGDRFRINRVGFPGHTNLATFKFYASGLHRRFSGAA